MPARRPLSLALVGIAVLAAAIVAAAALMPAAAHAAKRDSRRSCASYPRPGQLAPASAKLPAPVRREYRVFSHGHRPQKSLALKKLPYALPAAGIITSKIRYLGRGGDNGRMYAIPARHYLPYRLAPKRCLSTSQRQVEDYMHKALVKDYRHAAVCIAESGGDGLVETPVESCAPVGGGGDAFLSTYNTPLVGIAPNGVTAVTATFTDEPAKTVPVRHNFYVLVNKTTAEAPCGVQWFNDSDNPVRSFEGCDYLTVEQPLFKQYVSGVQNQITTVRGQVQTLAAAIAAGNLSEARSDWLTAHLSWLQIGQDDAAYGAFGALGGEIDDTAAGLPDGAADPGFTGFHKIEMDLWQDQDLTAAASDTAKLAQLLTTLADTPIGTYLPDNSTGVGNWLLRPHEILEDAIRDTLTGNDDYGSGSGVASITADVSATRRLLALLAPVLRPLAPKLIGTADVQLTRIDTAAQTTRVNGAWVAVSQLPSAQREALNAAVGAAAETLAKVPDLLTSTGSGAPPN